jgi:hypothetical protein
MIRRGSEKARQNPTHVITVGRAQATVGLQAHRSTRARAESNGLGRLDVDVPCARPRPDFGSHCRPGWLTTRLSGRPAGLLRYEPV